MLLGSPVWATKLLLSFCKGPARYTMQQFDKPKEAQLSISMPNPIVKNSVNRHRRAEAKFLKKCAQNHGSDCIVFVDKMNSSFTVSPAKSRVLFHL
jgi:hypothetical protein